MNEVRAAIQVGHRCMALIQLEPQFHILGAPRIKIGPDHIERLLAHIFHQPEIPCIHPIRQMFGQCAIIEERGMVVGGTGGCFREIEPQGDFHALLGRPLGLIKPEMGHDFEAFNGQDMGVVGHDCSVRQSGIYAIAMTEPTITCINGRFARAHRAAVPVADRGFRFGDGVFETIRIVGGVPYQWELHMQRMAQGLAALRISIEVPWDLMAKKTIQKNAARDGYLRIAVSRGMGSRGYQPFPPDMPASFAIEYLPPLPAPEKPYRLWLSNWAKIPANCLPGKFKLAQGVNSILAVQDANQNGCDEALQLSTDGMVSEAGSANIFWLAEGALHTPSLETNCLSGTTREAVMRLSHLPVRVVNVGLPTLQKADAVFITNTRFGIHPVSGIEPLGFTFATNHPDMQRLVRAVQDDRDRYRTRHAEGWK